MNSATNEIQKSESTLSSKANASKALKKGDNNDESSMQRTEDSGNSNTEQRGNVTSLKGQKSQTSQKSQQEDDDTNVEASSPKQTPSSFFDKLDLALVDASISIGDVVKKIDALAPKEGGISRAAKFTSQKLQGVQNYLGDKSSTELISDAWGILKRSAWPVGLAVAGAGIGIYIQSKVSSPKAEPETANEAKSKSPTTNKASQSTH